MKSMNLESNSQNKIYLFQSLDKPKLDPFQEIVLRNKTQLLQCKK
jgi:hypothetical protein